MVFKVLLKNVIKALYLKVIRILMEIRKLLPAQYHDHLPLFKGDIAAELPPYRTGIDYIFILEKGEKG